MKEKVIKLLIKRGHNEQEVIKMVEENFDTAVACLPEPKAAKIAEFLLYV